MSRLMDNPFAPVLTRIQHAGGLRDLKDVHDRLPDVTAKILSDGGYVSSVTYFLSDVADRVLAKVIEWVMLEHGPAPGAFSFLVMGSLCRQELTLNADQDNAIVYADVQEDSIETTRRYFLDLGETVCRLLDDLGYPLCKGGFMAQNPEWCQPLSVWKAYYDDWVLGFDPDSQVHFGLFFDFRTSHGDPSLNDILREHLCSLLADSKGFFHHMSEIAQRYEVPLGHFGRIKRRKVDGDEDLLDIKEASEPIVFIARLLAYQHNIKPTNTLERLNQLGEQGVLEAHLCRSIIQAYTLLMQIRLGNQIKRDHHKFPENLISLRQLNAEERYLLKEALRTIRAFKHCVA